MTATTQPDLGFAPNEDPFIVAHGGFYRRWLSAIDDIEELKEAVSRLEGTTEDKWIPVWEEMGRRHEAEGDRLEEAGDHGAARRAYLNAKSYYAIGRFPGEISEAKKNRRAHRSSLARSPKACSPVQAQPRKPRLSSRATAQ